MEDSEEWVKFGTLEEKFLSVWGEKHQLTRHKFFNLYPTR